MSLHAMIAEGKLRSLIIQGVSYRKSIKVGKNLLTDIPNPECPDKDVLVVKVLNMRSLSKDECREYYRLNYPCIEIGLEFYDKSGKEECMFDKIYYVAIAPVFSKTGTLIEFKIAWSYGG